MNNEVSSMRKSISMLAAAVVLSAGLVPAADALTVSVVPQASAVNSGDTVSVDVVVDLQGDNALSLGSYDLDLSFDSSVLSFGSLSFGTGLSVTGVPSFVQEYHLGTGTLNALEASWETTADLIALQPDAFTLFTITFNAAQVGTSLLSLSVNSLGNAAGTESLAAAVLGAPSISVTGAPAVPLPAAVWLLLSGLGVVRGLGRSHKSC